MTSPALDQKALAAALRAWLDWPAGSNVAGHSQMPRMEAAVSAFLASLPAPEPGATEPSDWVFVPAEPTIAMLEAMPTLPPLKLADMLEVEHLTPGQYQNRVRYLAAIEAAPRFVGAEPPDEPIGPSSPSHQGLREALEALVNRLDFIHADDEFKAVWFLAALHGQPYAGPTYEAELNAARAALQSQPAPSGETK